MAMIEAAFVKRYLNIVASLLDEEVTMLYGLKGELQKLTETVKTIGKCLEDAEKKRIPEEAIKQWLHKLRDVMYDADDITDVYKIHIGRHKNTILLDHRMPSVRCHSLLTFPSLRPCFASLAFGHKIGSRIKGLNKRLDSIYEERSKFHLQTTNPDVSDRVSAVDQNRNSTSQLVQLDTVGLQEDTRNLVEELIKEERDSKQRFLVFAILGMGGIGKTTLAQKIHNDQRIKDSFNLRIWLCVSKNYSAADLLKEMIRSAGGEHGSAQSIAELELKLHPLLSGKKIFLALDNVWEPKVWEKLLKNILVTSEAACGRILVTTRLEDVSNGMGTVYSHHVKELPAHVGWEMLCKKVFGDDISEEGVRNLQDVGMQLVEKCRGLPLAIDAVAGVLKTKEKRKTEWMKVLDNQAWMTKGELPEDLHGALYLSYEDLPSHLKQCFLYFSLFPEGFLFFSEDLARLWVAEGYVKSERNALAEDLAEDYFKELVRRNILQPDPRYIDRNSRCTMHDLLRSLAIFLARDESLFGDEQELNNCSSSLKLRRLSLASSTQETEDVTDSVPDKVKGYKCLRTLMLYTGLQTTNISKDHFKRFRHLRVLDLSWTGIKSLPDSVGNLVQLRLLDLDGTGVTQLPDSIGSLWSLQTLNLSVCKSLHALPNSIAELCNLRCLRLVKTPVNHLPPRIGGLQHLNHLEGFVVSEQQNGCSLEELQSLSQLRYLLINNLERASTATSSLTNKPHLRVLLLHCTVRTSPRAQEEMDRIERVFDDLLPPECLEALTIKDYFGRRYPSWMMLSSSLITSFPYLTSIYFQDCCSSPQLPPLGQLPELRSLTIVGASAVITIGQEFLGLDSRKPFPMLEILKMFDMPNWEEWSVTEMPRLKQLGIKNCPKLKALPEGLKCAKSLEILHIEGVHELRAIENLPASPKLLQLSNNLGLETIAGLAALINLMIRDCPVIERVEGVGALRSLHLIDSSLDALPDWLLELVGSLQEFRLECNDHLFLRCIEGAGYWPDIHQVSVVTIITNYGCGAYLYYTKMPYTYKSNVHSTQE